MFVLLGLVIPLALAAPVLVASGIGAPDGAGVLTDLIVGAPVSSVPYVGFYGNITASIIRSGGDYGQSLFNHTLHNGTVYVTRANNVLNSWDLEPAPLDEHTDGNLSLSGDYLTRFWFEHNGTEGCGLPFDENNGLPQLNTTDNFTITLLRNASTGSPAYLACTRINTTVSENGLGIINYELIVPKDSDLAAYDFYVEGGYI